MRRVALPLIALLVTVLLAASVARAQDCAAEREPNDDAATAQQVAGAFCVAGGAGGPGQDAFVWTLSAADAARLWGLRVEAFPGEATALALLRLLPAAEPGGTREAKPLLTRTSQAGDMELGPAPFEAGDYLITVTVSGGPGLYRLSATAAADTPAPVPGEAQTGAFALTVAAPDADLVVPWRIDASAAERRWTLSLQAPAGSSTSLLLRDAAGIQIAYSYLIETTASLSDLALQAGDYQIVVPRPRPGTTLALRADAGGRRNPAVDEEPNDTPATAGAFDPVLGLSGRLLSAAGYQDADYLRLTLDETWRDRRFDLVLRMEGEGALALVREDGADIQERSGAQEVRLPDLVLKPGSHLLRVRGALPAEATYTLTLEDRGVVSDGEEREPNDVPALAAPLGPDWTVSGRLAGAEVDAYAFVVEGAPQLWLIEAEGPGVRRVVHEDASGASRAEGWPAAAGAPARITSLLLLPGRHVVTVHGEDGPYRLRAIPQGAFDAARDEIEPNGSAALAQPLSFGITRHGRIERAEDHDLYRFSLLGEMHVRLRLTGIPGVGTRATLTAEEHPIGRVVSSADASEPVIWDGRLPAGDYFVDLSAFAGSQDPYEITLERRPWFDETPDLEPNDAWQTARPLPEDFRIAGTLFPEDSDTYRLPDLPSGTPLRLQDAGNGLDRVFLTLVQVSPPPGGTLWAARDVAGTIYLARGAEPGLWTADLPGGEVYLKLENGNGAYEATLSFGEALTPTTLAPPALEASLRLEVQSVAAFADAHQQVSGVLTLANTGDAPLQVVLETHAGEERWQVTADPPELALAPGARTQAAVTVEVAPGALADVAIPISIAARVAGSGTAAAEQEITPAVGAAPVAPFHAPRLPPSMLGGLNVAWSALGGTSPDNRPKLIDGLSGPSSTMRLSSTDAASVQPVIDLAGDAPVSLAGLILDSWTAGGRAERLRDFAVSASLDGVTFTPVLRGRLSPRAGEQAFAFPAPVAARFLRLEPIDNQSGDARFRGADLGELKAVAAETPPELRRIDIARPELGGHVVWQPAEIYAPESLLSPEDDSGSLWLGDGAPPAVEWVVAFRSNRAAQVVEFNWQDQADAPPESLVQQVRLASSMESATGPWTPLGTWLLERSAGAVAPFVLPARVWARYVRYTVEAAPGARNLALPERIGIIERPAQGAYRSIVGEWGGDGRAAIFEQLEPQAEAADAVSQDDGDSVVPLIPGETVSGTVQLRVDEDVYTLDVPAELPHLELTVGGPPPDDVALALQTEAGEAVALTLAEGSATMQRFTTDLAPGRYRLRVSEPPRSVIVAWDTSGSVAGEFPSIVKAVLSLVAAIEPGREEANLLPFRGPGSKPLLPDWSGEPLAVFAALQNYPWADSSSNAEAALLGAVEAFRGRPGVHAVVVITDAETDGATLRAELWRGFAETQPRIFVLAVPTSTDGAAAWRARAAMHDWAAVNGGFVDVLGSSARVEGAFSRLAAALRGPAAYTLTAMLFPPPEPGRIEVLPMPEDAADTGAPALVTDQAVEIILDASGSMLQRLDGVRRIEIARDMLNRLTTETLPAQLPFALRVFGQGAPGSCDTELVLPLGPLHPEAAIAAIRDIMPTNLAKTPIAASLRLVAQDLAGAAGQRLVILLTDGEETCDGDVPAEIAALRAAGIEVRINIVGFAVDDPALVAMFQDWAEQGGGRFFSASDAASLDSAMKAAVRPEFEVLDTAGEVVLRSVVGSPPAELPAGSYTVRILGTPARTLTEIRVAPGETTSLPLD